MSKTEKTDPEMPTTDSPDAGGGETILDKRVTVLETEMKHLATKADLKGETSGLKADMAEIKEILKHVVTKDDIKILDHVVTKDDIKILDRVATQDDIKILDHVATQDDIKILEHVATKEDIQRQRVWILSGAIGVVFTLVLIGLGAYRIFVG